MNVLMMGAYTETRSYDAEEMKFGLRLLPALLVLAACDSSEICAPLEDQSRRYLGVVATTAGEVVRSFPLDPGSRGLHAADAHLILVDDDLLLVTTLYFAKIFDLSSGLPVAMIPSGVPYTAREGSIYAPISEIGRFAYTPEIATFDRVLSSSIERLTQSASGNTTRSQLFEAQIQKSGDDRFETVQYLLALPHRHERYRRPHRKVVLAFRYLGIPGVRLLGKRPQRPGVYISTIVRTRLVRPA